jgi:hypothetical protein
VGAVSLLFKAFGVIFAIVVTLVVVTYICWLAAGKQVIEVSKKRGIVVTWSLFGFTYKRFYMAKDIHGINQVQTGEFMLLNKQISLFGELKHSVKVSYNNTHLGLAYGLSDDEAESLYTFLVTELDTSEVHLS